MKNKKGFTLIELLAIIVILAIIAVITVPIILNVIENSKRGAATDSAYGYKDAIEKFYVSKLSLNPDFKIENGTYTPLQLKNLGATVSGKEPLSNSWVSIQNNNVNQGCLQFDEYKVEINQGVVGQATKGQCTSSIFNGTFVAPSETDTHLGIVYMDPSNIANECDAKHAVSTPGTKTGCMKFYIMKDNNNGTVDLILDHNTSLGVEWSNYQEGYTYYNYHGPDESLYQLYEDTKNWTDIPYLDSSKNYSITWIDQEQEHSFTIDYTKHINKTGDSWPYTYTEVAGASKARLVSAEEIMELVGVNTPEHPDNWTLEGPQYFFDSKATNVAPSSTNKSNWSWLFENLYECGLFGCYSDSNIEAGNYKYWTSTPSLQPGFNNNTWKDVWTISAQCRMAGGYIEYENTGIRPIITMPKVTIGANI